MNLIHLYFTIHYSIHALVYHMILIQCYFTRLKLKNPVIAFHYYLSSNYLKWCFVRLVFSNSTHHHSFWSKKPFIQHMKLLYRYFHLLFNCLIIHHSVSCMTFSKALYRISLVTCIQYNHSFFTIVIMSLSVIANFLIHFLAIVWLLRRMCQIYNPWSKSISNHHSALVSWQQHLSPWICL